MSEDGRPISENGDQTSDIRSRPSDRRSPSSENEPSLTARVVRGAGWVFAGKIVGRGLSLVKLVVLARLLVPEDFGLFGIVMLAIAALQTFTQTGFSAALIQRQDNTEDYLDTAWTVQVIRGFVLAGVLFAAAPAVGWFFEEPRCVLLLRVMCISVVLGGFGNVGTIYFQKKLQFHKQVIWGTASALVSLAVSVYLAYRLRSVWALVWAGLAGAAVTCALSYAIHPYRPRPHFKPAQASELFRFGRWVLGSSVLIFLITHGDDAFLGKVLGVGALGIYQMAYRISNLPATQITHTVSATTFPAFSKVASDLGRFRAAYLKTLGLTMHLATPIAAGIAAVASAFVPVVLGDGWSRAIIPMQLLCVFGWLRAYGATLGPVFYASGHPYELTKAALLQLASMVLLIYPLTFLYGISGTCLALTIPMAFAQLYATFRACRVLKLSPSRIGQTVLVQAIVGTVVFASAYAVVLSWRPSPCTLLGAILAGTVAFALCICTMHALGISGPLSRLKPLLASLRSSRR